MAISALLFQGFYIFQKRTFLYSTFTLKVEVLSKEDSFRTIRQHDEAVVIKIQTSRFIWLVDVVHCGFDEKKVTIIS
jgi:hypothetical protein